MLPRVYRLSRKEFSTVRSKGVLQPGRLVGVLLYSLPDDTSSSPKAGLIVSRRLSPHAVLRNRLKRRIRAALAPLLISLTTPLWMVVLPTKRALEASVQELEQDLHEVVHNHRRS